MKLKIHVKDKNIDLFLSLKNHIINGIYQYVLI